MDKDNYVTEDIINDIASNLASDMPLSEYQKECIMYALNKVRDVRQRPYYEVVYHDEYDRTEHRIMEPVSVNIIDNGNIKMREDRFELFFRRAF